MIAKVTYNPFRIVHGVVQFTANFLANQWRQYNQLGQMLFVFAVAAIAVDAGVSYQYGRSMTVLHGVGFAIVAIAFCLLPDVAVTEWRKGNKHGAWPVAAGSVLLGLVALQSHIGYGGGVRLKEMQQTNFQHAKATDVRDLAKSETANLAMWRKSLEDKQAEYAAAKQTFPWVATVKSDGLKSQLATHEERMGAEEKGKRGRAAGRGKEFESLQNQANDLRSRIASIEKFNELGDAIEKLKGQIEATQKMVDQKINVVAKTGYESNTVVNQNDIIVSLVNFVRGINAEDAIKPDEVQRVVANTAVTGFNSIGFLICAPLLMLAAGLNRRLEFFGMGHGFVSATPTMPMALTATGTSGDTVTNHTSFMIADDKVAQQIKDIARNFVEKSRSR
jgi:hypothetical protein